MTSSIPKFLPNLLLVSGTGRNSGKTLLICRLIEELRNCKPVAVKISPHWHLQDPEGLMLYKEGQLLLMREHNIDGEKDSSRMLRSGASVVYYIQAVSDHLLPEAFDQVLAMVPSDTPIIVESASLSMYYKPGLHIGVGPDAGVQLQKNNALFNNIPVFIREGEHFSPSLSAISWQGKWSLDANW